jgi:hypothetical protein
LRSTRFPVVTSFIVKDCCRSSTCPRYHRCFRSSKAATHLPGPNALRISNRYFPNLHPRCGQCNSAHAGLRIGIASVGSRHRKCPIARLCWAVGATLSAHRCRLSHLWRGDIKLEGQNPTLHRTGAGRFELGAMFTCLWFMAIPRQPPRSRRRWESLLPRRAASCMRGAT